MRADMHKVVVERERHGSTGKNRKWGQRLAFVPDTDYDDQPKFVSSARGRQYSNNHKWFTDVLGPLEGCFYAATSVARGTRCSANCARALTCGR